MKQESEIAAYEIKWSPRRGLGRAFRNANIISGHIVQFKAIKEGNRGKIVCNSCGHNAWDVPNSRDFINVAGSDIDKIVEAAQLLREKLSLLR